MVSQDTKTLNLNHPSSAKGPLRRLSSQAEPLEPHAEGASTGQSRDPISAQDRLVSVHLIEAKS